MYKNIAIQLKARGLTQRRLAGIVEVNAGYLNLVLNGKRHGEELRRKVGIALNANPAWLFNVEEEKGVNRAKQDSFLIGMAAGMSGVR